MYPVCAACARPSDGALDIIQTDCNVTGLIENWYIARIAHQRGKFAAIPNHDYCELNQTPQPAEEG